MNLNKTTKIILSIIWIILFIYLIVEIFWNSTEIPYVNIGSSVVFYEELDENAKILDIDATDEYIFFAYSQDVVSAYDWDGEFKFSIALYNEKNGLISIRCVDDKLYILDARENVFVYEGPKLIDTILRDQSQYEVNWFNESNGLVQEHDEQLFDQNGKYIMDVQGQGEKAQNQELLIILASILIAGVALIIRRTKYKQ